MPTARLRLNARAGHSRASEHRRALAAAAETVGAGPALPGERGTLRALVEQGEWVRLELAALSRSEVPGVSGTLGAAAKALDAIAAGSDPASSLTDLARSAPGDRRARRAQAGGEPGRVDRGGGPGREPCRRARRGTAPASAARIAGRAHIALQRVPSRGAAVGCAGRRRDCVPRPVARLGLLGSALRSCSCSSPTTGPRWHAGSGGPRGRWPGSSSPGRSSRCSPPPPAWS